MKIYLIISLPWNEVEAYKLLKSRIELENFTAKTAKAVRQDFHVKVLLIKLCAAYAHPIEEKVIEEYKADEKRKYDQKNKSHQCNFDDPRHIDIGIHSKAVYKGLTSF